MMVCHLSRTGEGCRVLELRKRTIHWWSMWPRRVMIGMQAALGCFGTRTAHELFIALSPVDKIAFWLWHRRKGVFFKRGFLSLLRRYGLRCDYSWNHFRGL